MHVSDDSKQPLDWFKHINENTYSSEGPREGVLSALLL